MKVEFYSWSRRMNSANLQTLKQATFILEVKRYKALSIDTERGEEPPKGRDYSNFVSLLVLLCTFLVGS